MTATHETMGRGRLTRLRRGIGASAISRAIAVLAPLITIPISLQALGVTAYGAWSAALALVGFATFADLGLGAGVMTRLAEETTRRNFDKSRAIVSSAYAALGITVTLLLAFLWGSSLVLDYGRLVGGGGATELSMIVLITLTAFLINIPVALIVRIQYGSQQIAQSNFWQIGASIASVIATLAAAAMQVPSPVFIAIASFAPALLMALNTGVFFMRGSGRAFRPRIGSASLREAMSLLRLGLRFLFINILIAATMTTDGLIVAHTAGLDAVPDYAIPARLFSVMAVATAVLSGPLWPLHAEAMQRGDFAWVEKITKQIAMLTVVTAVMLAIVGFIAGPWLLEVWLGGQIGSSGVLLAGLGLVLLAQAAVSPYFMAQNAAQVLGPQMAGYSLLLLIVPAKWVISMVAGYEYIPYVTVVGYVLFLWPAVYIGYRRALKPRPSAISQATSSSI